MSLINLKTDQGDVISREWLNHLLIEDQRDIKLSVENNSGYLVDMFRLAYPKRSEAFTCWSARTNARQTNYGLRLDYILFDSSLVNLFPPCRGLSELHTNVMHSIEGSDHCPVWTNLPYKYNRDHDLDYALPRRCSRFWPQCQGKQMGLDTFLATKANLNGSKHHEPITSSTANKKAAVHLNLKRSNQMGKVKGLKQMKIHFRDKLPTPNETRWNPEAENLLAIVKAAELSKSAEASEKWRRLLCGPCKPPLCSGHSEECVMRTVKKKQTSGNRIGRQFWVCARPDSAPNNSEARCNTFVWVDGDRKH